MSTHAAIIMKSGIVYTGIYCHFDGYLGYMGKILKEHYTDPDKVKALINLGDISQLGKETEPTTLYHSYANPEKDVTIAYHRDRGEDSHYISATTVEDVAANIDHNDNVYLFSEGKWTYNGESF